MFFFLILLGSINNILWSRNFILNRLFVVVGIQMGQTNSHSKVARAEFLKNSQFQSRSSQGSQSIEYQEDIDEDDVHPTMSSRSSYSPSDYIPTFRFQNQTTPIGIGASNQREEPTNKKIPVVFKYLVRSAREVNLIGTFTNWEDQVPMVKSDGDYVTIVDLPEGEHQYKFVVDGRWEHDPNQVSCSRRSISKDRVVWTQVAENSR